MIENFDLVNVIKQISLAIISSGVFGIVIKYFLDNRQKKRDHEFQQALEEVRSALNSGTYITNMQYEREFNLLVDFWDKLIGLEADYYDYINDVVHWNPIVITVGNTNIDECIAKTENIKEKCNQYCHEMSRYEPFFDSDISNHLRKIPEVIINTAIPVENYLNDIEFKRIKNESFDIISSKISESQTVFMDEKRIASEAIRDYLNSLKVK